MSQLKKINKNLNLFIGVYKMPYTLCDQLIDVFERCPNKLNDVESHRGYISHSGKYVLNDNIELKKNFYSFLENCLEKYKKKYKSCDEFADPWHFEQRFNIQKYPPGKYYSKAHSEINYNFPSIKRHLVFMTYLNTIKNGGGTQFINQNLIVKPKKGHTLFWPAHWTHTHIGIPAPKETKYIITGWYEYVNDKLFFESAENFLNSIDNNSNVRIQVIKK